MRMVLVTMALVLFARAAIAQPATADAEAKLAEDAAANGDFITAANHYKLAYAADARPDLICNAGVAYYKAKDVTRAHLYLTRCQERGAALGAEFVSAVRSALDAVEATLRAGQFTPVDIVVKPEGATVVVEALGDSDAFVGSRVVWVPRGKHTITARAEGYARKSVVHDAQGSEPNQVSLTLEKALADQPLQVRDTPPVEPEAPSRRTSKVPALVAIGGTVLAFVVAGIAYSRAHDAADRAGDAITMETFEADRSSVNTWNRVMIGTGALGLGGVAVSTVLVLRW